MCGASPKRTNDPASWIDLADYYAQQHRDADAIRILEKLSNDPNHGASARRRIAVIAHSAGRQSEAHAILADLIKRNPADSEALTTRARLLLSDRRHDEALDVAKSATQANPRSATAHSILGRVLIARGDIAQARRALAESITPGSTRAGCTARARQPSSFRRRNRRRGRARTRSDRGTSR